MRGDGVSTPLTNHTESLRVALLGWFEERARKLPWRDTSDPYLIWISEIILQQTRVDQGLPYYTRFTQRFPTVQILAQAPIDDVLKMWEGLGYYSRARNLHKAAAMVVSEFDGQIPAQHEQLLTLPGIGRYTAAAILSIAFNQPYGVVDGNVVRVLARLTAFDKPVETANSRRFFQSLADRLVDPNHPGRFNESVMELGATVCSPRKPRCTECPVVSYCAAQSDDPERFPNKRQKEKVPHHDIAVGVLKNQDGELFIQRRPETGLLGGLWEFPGGKREEGESIQEACQRELKEELGIDVQVGELITSIPHAYSHFKITLHAFNCDIEAGDPASSTDLPIAWIAADQLEKYAFPRANRKLIEALKESNEN